MATINRLSGPRGDSSAAGGEEMVAGGNSVALCVVVPDMPRLSLDRALGPREKHWMEISDGTVLVKQYRGCRGLLLGFVLVGPPRR